MERRMAAPREGDTMATSTTHTRGTRGFSVAEVLTILAAFAVLGGLTAPAIYDYIEDARLIRARHEATTIAVSLVRLFDDVGSEGGRPKGWASYDVLVGVAPCPARSPTKPQPGRRQRARLAWARSTTNWSGMPPSTRRIGRQAPLDGGPYVQETVDADPWGHRYGVNVRALRTTGSDTFVLSAGPDGVVATPFAADGLTGASTTSRLSSPPQVWAGRDRA
jgi:hypothetical protein